MGLFNEDQLKNLKNLFADFNEEEFVEQPEIDDTNLLKELEKQAEEIISENDLLFMDDFDAPSFDDGSKKRIEVENIGRLMVVDIDFSKNDLSDEESSIVKDAIRTIARSKSEQEINRAKNEILAIGENAVFMMFRESRQFDFSYPEVRKNVAQVMGEITKRNLKGRNVVLGVIKAGRISSQVQLAILTAGQLRDRNSVVYILQNMDNPEYFEICLEALIKIKPSDKEVVKEIMYLISNLDEDRKDLIDVCMKNAPDFKNFGTEAAEIIFEAYNSCKQPFIKPIFTNALKQMKEDSVWFLKKQLNEVKDDDDFFNICQTLGRMKNGEAVRILVEAFDRYSKDPRRKLSVIKGLSLSGDEQVLPIIIKILTDGDKPPVISECLKALAYIGDNSVATYAEPFLDMKEERYYVDAVFVKARRGDREALKELVNCLIDGDSVKQNGAQRLISMLSHEQLMDIAQSTLTLPESRSILIISALNRVRILPREIGTVLKELLKKNSLPLKVEIYRLIGKYANSQHEILPQEILYEAGEMEENPRVRKEIENIISKIPKKEAKITYLNEGDN